MLNEAYLSLVEFLLERAVLIALLDDDSHF